MGNRDAQGYYSVLDHRELRFHTDVQQENVIGWCHSAKERDDIMATAKLRASRLCDYTGRCRYHSCELLRQMQRSPLNNSIYTVRGL